MCNVNYSVFLLRISLYVYATEKDTTQHGRLIVLTVVFISLWKLQFLAYVLNVTRRFVMRIISYAIFFFICV